MLTIKSEYIRQIESGIRVTYSVLLYMQEVYTFTENDRLISIGDLTFELNDSDRYEIANTNIVLENSDYFFSRLFALEFPIRSIVEIYLQPFNTLMFRGVVENITLTSVALTLAVTI